ncbi:MAG: alpha/beta hydrolase [Actinobacteria bacterium]|nr:alpha/beta hydrolase [Actinomycetota bacterium]
MGRTWKILLAVLAGLALLIALNTIIVNHATKQAKVTVPGGRILALTDGDLQVKEDGPPTAPPIVLLHGYVGSIRWWDAITPELAKDHHVIRIDLLGHGGSEKPASGYTMKHQAELVAEALNKLGVAGATVVGSSLGGTVATALAETSPQLVARIVVIDTPPQSSYSHTPFKHKLSRMPVIGQLFWRVGPRSETRKGLEVAFAKGFDFPESFVDDLKGMTYSAYKKSYVDHRDYIDEQSVNSRLQPLAIPLLVIWGAADRFVDPAAAQAYADVPGAQIETIPGAGHSPQVEKPAETAALILEFAVAGEKEIAKELEQARARKAAQRAAERRKKRSEARHKKRRSGHRSRRG